MDSVGEEGVVRAGGEEGDDGSGKGLEGGSGSGGGLGGSLHSVRGECIERNVGEGSVQPGSTCGMHGGRSRATLQWKSKSDYRPAVRRLRLSSLI